MKLPLWLHQRVSYTVLLRSLLGLAIVIVFFLCSFPGFEVSLISQIERNVYDLQLRATMPNTVDDRIVIVDIDENSIEKLGHWPWHRTVIADCLDALFNDYKVKTVGFDMVFPEKEDSDAAALLDTLAGGPLGENADFKEAQSSWSALLDYDKMFGDAIANRSVVMGIAFDDKIKTEKNILTGEIAILSDDLVGRLPIPRPQGYRANVPYLQVNARAIGFFDNSSLDDDGIFRRVPPVQEYEGRFYPSLAFALAQQALDGAEFTFSAKTNVEQPFIKSFQLGNKKIPTDLSVNEIGLPITTLLVPYRGKANSFPYISFNDVLSRATAPELLKDKIVLIGTTSVGLKDMRATPVGSNYPGVEVHANLISAILDDRFLYQPSSFVSIEASVILFVGLLAVGLSGRLSPMFSAAFTLMLVSGVIVGRIILWNKGLVMPIVPVVLMILSLFMLDLLYGFFVQTNSRREITKRFGQYAPPEVVAEMADNPENISMDSQSKELTVLFSDVRGFTTLSEKVDASELSLLMNALLSPLTQVIHAHRGTIDKYMGDAIMAFWGAPLPQPDHASRAVSAALELQRAVPKINADFIARGWPSISIGVGLNTGSMAVGNMGSTFRMAYTVLGDAVNLGSRLEGLTRQYGTDVIVGEATRQAAPEFLYRELDRVKVKGKEQPVTIYEPLVLQAEAAPDLLQSVEAFHQALACYRAQDWDGAEEKIGLCLQDQPDCELYTLYLERIAYFRQHSPETADGCVWDGVFTHKTKS